MKGAALSCGGLNGCSGALEFMRSVVFAQAVSQRKVSGLPVPTAKK